MTAQVDQGHLASALHRMNPFSDAPSVGVSAPTASSMKEKFYRYFQEEVTELQDQIEQLQHRALVGGERQDAIDHVLAGISHLSNEVADASSYLPAYDQRTYSQAVKALSEKLQEVRQKVAPRKKFTFQTSQKNSSAISLNDAATLAQEQQRSLKPPVAVRGPDSSTESSVAVTPAFLKTPPSETTDALGDLPSFPNTDIKGKNYNEEMGRGLPGGGAVRKPSFSQAKTVQISDHRSLHIILPQSAAHATSSGSLTKLNRCIVDMSAPTTSTATSKGAAFAGLMLQNINSSLVIAGQVDGAAHVTNVKGSVVVVSSRQVRMHECHDVDIYLLCSGRPIIEDCSNVRFAPLPACYTPSTEAPVKNMWDQVDDFKWLKAEHSPNWSVLPEAQRLSEDIWTKTVPGGRGLGLEDILGAVGIRPASAASS